MLKNTIKKIAIAAIFMALGVALKFFSIGDGSFRISFWDIPLFMAGMILGPLWGALTAMGADLIYGLAFSSFPFSFIMMFTTIVWGFTGGFFYYQKKLKFWLLLIVVLITSIVATIINSIYLTLYQDFKTMLAGLPFRLLVLIVKWPITTSVLYLLSKLFQKTFSEHLKFK